MKVLWIDTPAFGKEDLSEAMGEAGLTVSLFSHDEIFDRSSAAVETALTGRLEKEAPSFVFSFNYFPAVSRCCQAQGIPYASYVYDSPLLSLFSSTVLNPCNYIFLFDCALCEKLRLQGISTVYYLPLAANPKRLEQLIPDGQFREAYGCDISFVGSLYNESHHLFERLDAVNPYTKGYLDAIMNAQLSVSGCYLMEDLLTENITRELQRVCPYRPAPDGTESDAYVYANYFIARKLAEQERTRILQLLSERYRCMLYTHQPTPELPHIQNMGAIDPYESFPLVCKCSRINLNITLRSIESGIPQRAWDILGAGGFLLTNYQADFDGLFTAGEDYVYYVDDDDLLAKADYYLTHEKERQEIAENGHRKVVSGNTYGHRLRAMLDTMNYPITTTSVL